jgi:protein gp138
LQTFEPSEVEIIRTAIRARQADIRTAMPAMIDSYDAATQTCTCVLAVRVPTHEGVPEELPPLTDVPVKWQRGGGYFCSMPLAKGDPGLLVFCEADFSAWRETGEVSDPAQDRRHGLYAYFLPGGCADGHELASAAPDALVIGKDGGDVIKINASGIELGASASQFVALANLVSARLDTIQAAFDAHTHPVPGVTPGPGATTSSVTAGLIGTLAPVAASKVKAQ